MVINFDKFKREEKWREFKAEAKHRWYLTKEWCFRNKEWIIIATPFVIRLLTKTTSVVGKNINLRKEEKIKHRNVYNPSTGHYYKLKRELTSKEWLQVDRRRRRGEMLGDILDDMRVLK